MAKKKIVENPTQAELEDYLEHYLYEIQMLSAAYNAHNLFNSAKMLDPNSVIVEVLANATLESFLVHTRCLVEFFHADEPRKYQTGGKFDLNLVDKDIVAQHYISNWAALRAEVRLKTNLPMDRFREISRQLSHLSRNRSNQHKWLLFEIYPDLLKLHEQFVENLPPELKNKFFK
jgi:hypothetical protein